MTFVLSVANTMLHSHMINLTAIYSYIVSSHTSARAKAADEKFVKLREVYQKLRGEHIVLLRSNGEAQKKLLTVEKAKVDVEGEAKVSSLLQ